MGAPSERRSGRPPLKRDKAATRPLTAARFDKSADIHSISSGPFDPETRTNVPLTIGGQPVVDRLSFHFRSGYWLNRGKISCEDIRAGCASARGR